MLIEGKKIALEVREQLKRKVALLDFTPRLAIILIGDNEASTIYVRNKIKACLEVGIKGEVYAFKKCDKEEDVVLKIKELDQDIDVRGIIVQSPVPLGFDEEYLNSFISPEKDVDGFGITNMGHLASNDEKMMAATPLGIIKMLEYYNILVEGLHVVIVGVSKIVGRPLGLAMLNRGATVTMAHDKTKNLKEITRMADVLVVAIGQAEFIDDSYVKDGAIVIDVGINRVKGKIVGDVDFSKVQAKTSYITPVPGGVGPMTVAMLLSNVVESAKWRSK